MTGTMMNKSCSLLWLPSLPGIALTHCTTITPANIFEQLCMPRSLTYIFMYVLLWAFRQLLDYAALSPGCSRDIYSFHQGQGTCSRNYWKGFQWDFLLLLEAANLESAVALTIGTNSREPLWYSAYNCHICRKALYTANAWLYSSLDDQCSNWK